MSSTVTFPEFRRYVLIATSAALCMFAFLTVYDEPMSAPYVPTLRQYHVDTPRMTRRVGRFDFDSFTKPVIRTAAADYLDIIRDAVDASGAGAPLPSAFDPADWEHITAHAPLDINDTAGTMQTASLYVTDASFDKSAAPGLARLGQYDVRRLKSLALPGLRREDVRGFLHLPTVWGTSLEPAPEGLGAADRVGSAVSRFTGIQVTEDPHVFLDSPRLLDYPVLYLTARNLFDLSRQERNNLRRYLEAGGFIIMDNTAPKLPYNGLEASFNKMVRDITGSQGGLAIIPNYHPIYHSVFDFDMAPIGREMGSFLLSFPASTPSYWLQNSTRQAEKVYHLEGIWFHGRLAGVFADKGYIQNLIHELGYDGFRMINYLRIYVSWYELSFASENPTWKFHPSDPVYHPATFKFVTNMVVYALLDPRGMTQRRMRAAVQ